MPARGIGRDGDADPALETRGVFRVQVVALDDPRHRTRIVARPAPDNQPSIGDGREDRPLDPAPLFRPPRQGFGQFPVEVDARLEVERLVAERLGDDVRR